MQKQKKEELQAFTVLKQRQTRLIACSKKILNAGTDVAEASYRFFMINMIIKMTTSIHIDSDKEDKTVAKYDQIDFKALDSESNLAFEEEWEEQIAGEVLTELEEALKTDNYKAMKEQQSRYCSNVQGKIESIEKIKREVESKYSSVHIPPEAAREQVVYMTELIVKFAVALNTFQEAINSMYEEGFDLTRVILLSMNHPAYKLVAEAFKLLCDALLDAVKWVEDKMKSADRALKSACSLQ